ncbi:MAG: DUF1565 domain-containing protein [Candidatus Eisenbacteria bacterium]|nr:DUF1565 domain-containing protein [Candidatus Eisenbacteria bacterium]
MRGVFSRLTGGRAAGGRPGVRVAAVAALGALILMAAGCGSKDGDNGPAGPDGIALVLSRTRVQVSQSVQIEASYVYPAKDRQAPECDWYVNGVAGGDSANGTVTGTNPATYTAPLAVPPGGTVEISAVALEDDSFTAADTVTVAFTIRYVDSEDGSDAAGGGALGRPLRTLTFALGETAPGDTILLLPGTYDPDHGETGGYSVPDGMTLLGAHRDSCFIFSDGVQYATVTLGDGATFAHMTVGNWSGDSNGILTRGGGLIADIAIAQPFAFAAIRADGSERGRANDVVIEDCVLLNAVSPTTKRALELVNGTHCVVRNCTIAGWQYGAYINGTSDPLIEGCEITDNKYGVATASTGGVHTEPDLGGGARGSVGENTILGMGNQSIGLLNGTPATVYAINNVWNNDPPVESVDYLNTGGGSVIVTR